MRIPALLATGALALSPFIQPAFNAPSASAAETTREGTILYFNDAHEIGPVLTGGQDRGGVARLDSAIDAVRSEQPDTKVVFGGDLAGGTLFGGLYKGHPMVDAFNTIGVDLANLGQHDFDFGIDNTRELIANSNFPWITSNLLDSNGEPFLPGSTWAVQEIDGITVGYIGLVDSMDTTTVSAEITELDHVEAATVAIADLEASANPDVIVALAQVPHAVGESLVDALPQIDAVLMEEQAEYDSVVVDYKGAVLASSEGNMGSIIRLDVSLTAAGDATLVPSVIEVDHTVTPDPELRQLELQYAAEIDANLSQVLATVETPLLNPNHEARQRETLIGNFVADSFRDYHGTQIGWMNGGGIRAEAPGPEFTLRDAYAIAPFDNKVVHVEVTGAGIRQALEDAVARVETLGGGFPQVSGMAYAYDPDAPVGERVHGVSVVGEPIDDAAVYSVAATNYVVGGGDSITGFADADVIVSAGEAPADAEAIAAYAEKLGVIDLELEARITVGAASDLAPTPGPTTAPTSSQEPAAEPTPTSTEGERAAPTSPALPGEAQHDAGKLATTGATSVAPVAILAALLSLAGATLWLLGRRRESSLERE